MTEDSIEDQMVTFCQEVCIHHNPEKPHSGEACTLCDIQIFVAWLMGELHE